MAPRSTPVEDDDDADMVAVDTQDGGAVADLEKPQPQPAVDHDDDDDVQDERLDVGSQEALEGETDEQREQKRAYNRRRRVAREERIRREREELSALRAQNEALSGRLAHLETSVVHTQAMTLESQRGRLHEWVNRAMGAYEAAFKAGEAQEALKLSEGIAEARRRIAAVEKAITERSGQQAAEPAERRPAAPQAQPSPYANDATVKRFAAQFMESNPEYDPSAPRPNSETILIAALDLRVLQEGYDPRTPKYWQVLQKRVDQAMRGRDTGDDDGEGADYGADDAPPPQRSVPRGPSLGNARQPALKPGQVYVTPERKRALQDAGYWDDPKLRAQALREYSAYDKAQRANGRA